MMGMLLNVIHDQVKKSLQNHTTKTFNGIHNHCTLLTTVKPESPRGNKPIHLLMKIDIDIDIDIDIFLFGVVYNI